SPSNSLGFGTRFSTLDFMNSSDFVAGTMSRCSSPILRELSGSLGMIAMLPPPRANSSSPADDLIENLTSTLALLTQSYRTFLPQTNNQLRTSSNAKNQATVQDGGVVVQNVQGRPNRGQGMNPQVGSGAGYGEAQNRVGNVNQGQARPGQARTVKCYNCNGTCHSARNCTQPKRPQNSEYFKDKMMLMQAQENGVALDAEQLLFLAGRPDNALDDDVDEQPIQDLALNVDNVFQAEDYDAFDSDITALVPRAPNNELNSLPTLLLLGRSKLLLPDLLIGVTSYPKASGSQPKSNPKTNRISPAKGAKKLSVEDLPRTNKSHHRTTNRVDSSSRLKRTVINSNSDSICRTCNKCLTSFDHDICVATCVKSVVRPYSTRHNCKVEQKIRQIWKPKHLEQKMKQVWKPKPVRQVW
nr:hypothetical protein [Tanacetum cinerariifolium]